MRKHWKQHRQILATLVVSVILMGAVSVWTQLGMIERTAQVLAMLLFFVYAGAALAEIINESLPTLSRYVTVRRRRW